MVDESRPAEERAILGHENLLESLVELPDHRGSLNASEQPPSRHVECTPEIQAEVRARAVKVIAGFLFDELSENSGIEEDRRKAHACPPLHIPARKQAELPAGVIKVY